MTVPDRPGPGGADRPPLDPVFGPAGRLPDLVPGTTVEIVKLDPAGAEVVHYPGTMLGELDGWLVTEARWVNPTVTVGALTFHQGDRLIEWFSPGDPFNCFTVVEPTTGAVRGWYANVTHPARVIEDASPVRIVWHDLFLDVVCTADGDPVLHDQDELDAANLVMEDPDLHAAIIAAGTRIMKSVIGRQVPFIRSGWPENATPEGGENR